MAVQIRKLRLKYIVSRIVFILSLALAADLFYSLIAITTYNLWSLRINIPFLFETLLIVLLIREFPSWRLLRMSANLDRRFSLKDRLYSYVWYSRNRNVVRDVRQAQARESLSSIDFPAILSQIRIKYLFLLPLLLCLSGVLFFLSWNADYRPPGVATRILSSNFVSEHATGRPPTNPGLMDDHTDNNLEDDRSGTLASRERGDEKAGASRFPEEEKKENVIDAEKQAAGEDPAEPADGVPTDSSRGGQGTGQGHGGSGGVPASSDPPENIKSFPVSTSISEPVPPSLRNISSYAFQALPDATRFLRLIPGQSSGSFASPDQETVSNFEEGIVDFPDLYRVHLQTYYRELKKWDQNP